MSKLIGTNPNQVPTNADLGTMAYMDYDSVAPVLIGGRRNLIINGAMQMWQRGESISNIYSTQYTADRWHLSEGSATVFSAEKSTDAPSGFGQSYKLTVTTPDTVTGASDYAEIRYSIEAQDCQALGHGTAGARDAVLSFWIKSSVAGNYATYFYKPDSGRGMYSNYTIDNANTWEYKTIVIPADASGTINNDTGQGLNFYFLLMAGSNFNTGTSPRNVWGTYTSSNIGVGGEAGTELCATSGATWQITGVQLEYGSVATPFEHRSYGEELALCQRYFQKTYEDGTSPATATRVSNWYVNAGSTGILRASRALAVPMRATPTITLYCPASGVSGQIEIPGGQCSSGGSLNTSNTGSTSVVIYMNGQTAGGNHNIHFTADAEL